MARRRLAELLQTRGMKSRLYFKGFIDRRIFMEQEHIYSHSPLFFLDGMVKFSSTSSIIVSLISFMRHIFNQQGPFDIAEN